MHFNSLTTNGRSPRLILTVATAVAAAQAWAEQIDPNAVILQRLKTTSAASLPGGLQLKSVKISSDLRTDGIRFRIPSIIPERPLVLMQQNISNCGNKDAVGKTAVKKETENAESFTKSSTLGGETSVTVSYSSPLGLGASATQSFNYSNTNAEAKTYADKVVWDQGLDVAVGPREALTVQFVVAQQSLDNIPWSTNVLVSGPLEMKYEKPPGKVKLCVFQHANYKGLSKCWTTDQPLGIARFSKTTWDGLPAQAALGGFGAFHMNDQISSFTLEGDADITFFWGADYSSWPVKYDKSSAYIGNHDNDEFSSVKIEPRTANKTLTVPIEQYLNEENRRIALSGLYRGVNGAQGDFRVGAPVSLSEADCRNKPTTPVVRTTTTAGTGAGSGQTLALVESVPVNPNTPVIQGKVLKAGVKPRGR